MSGEPAAVAVERVKYCTICGAIVAITTDGIDVDKAEMHLDWHHREIRAQQPELYAAIQRAGLGRDI